ncbi:hypothetical protein RHGRI_027859 [Rhododendron griersonianum]|uniref:Uncharacterized protein n=1 Tax=Rhododendron griersonianum TaxID=479676 RepID=A0AAV6J2P2_9ERIC|nr:hypothetical protein RHGRI_027859 [Rhododendron griersonianum]
MATLQRSLHRFPDGNHTPLLHDGYEGPKSQVPGQIRHLQRVWYPNTSINLKTNFALGTKNTNFGPYKYDNSTMYFYYDEAKVGTVVIPKSKAQFQRTKKFTVALDLASKDATGK